MIVRFYIDFEKRINSTKQVSGDNIYIEYSFVFKKPTDILNPTLLINTEGTLPSAWNYAIIFKDNGDIVGMYHVNTFRTITNTDFEIDLNYDYLATHKSDILNHNAYVIYSADSSAYNRWIKDDRCPIITRPPTVARSYSNPTISGNNVFKSNISTDEDIIILTTISQNTGLTDWVLTWSQLNYIMDRLTLAGSSVWGSLQEQFGDAFGSMISCIRLPINEDVLPISSGYTSMYLGSYHLEISSGEYYTARTLTSPTIIFRGSCGIPTNTYLDFRCFEPYTKLRCRLPFVGLVDISHQDFSSSIYYEGLINLRDGKITYTLYNDSNYAYAISTYTGICGGTVPIATQQLQRAEGIVNTLAGTGATLASALVNPSLGVLTGVAQVASAFYNVMDKTSNVMGSYSGGYSEIISNKIEVISEAMQTICEPSDLTDIEGRPCLQVLNLADLTGYVKTQGFSFNGNVPLSIKNAINNALDSGIYIE